MAFAEINSHELLWCELGAEPTSNFYLSAGTETYAVHPQPVKVLHGFTLRVPETGKFVQTPESIQFFRTFHIKPLVYSGLLDSAAVSVRADRKLYPHTLDTQVQAMVLRFLHHRTVHGDLQTWELIPNDADIRAALYLRASTQSANLAFVDTQLFKGMYFRADPNTWVVDMPEPRLLRMAILYPTVEPFTLISLNTPIRKDLRLFVNKQSYEWENQDGRLIVQRYLDAKLQTTLFEGGESSYTWLHVLKPLARLLQATEQDINLLKASKLWADLGTIESMGGSSQPFFSDFSWGEIVVIRPSELREAIRLFEK